MFATWPDRWFRQRLISSPPLEHSARRRPFRFRPNLELLEQRTVPSLTVMAIAGTPQSAVVNTAFATPLQALVEDSGNPVGAGVSVTFDAAPVGFPAPTGTFPNDVASVTVQTDASGIATAPTFTANTRAGTETLTATLADGTSTSFDLTNLPGPPAKVQGAVQAGFPPQYATLGTTFAQSLSVYVTDAYDNFVGAGAKVTFIAPPSGASGTFPGRVTSVTVTTAADSTATAPTLTANGIAGNYVVTASVPGGITTGDFDQQNVSPDAVIDQPTSSRDYEADLSSAGAVGSISFSYSSLPWFKSILTGLTSLTYNGQNSGTNYLIVQLPSSGPLLSGPVGLNVVGGSGVLGINGAHGPVFTQPGSFTVGGQTFIYTTGGTSVRVPGATGINSSVTPLYPPPEHAFVQYYFYGQGFTKFPVYMSPSQHFVQTLYLDVLGRTGTLAEVDFWVGVLNATGGSQAAVAADIEGSPEARIRLVNTWYQTYLGRQAQGGEEMGWVNLLLAGQTEEQVLGGILGSAEFFNRAQALAPSDTPTHSYLQALYQVLLGRSGSSDELAAWDPTLANLGWQGVALVFLQSHEFRTYQFEGYYNFLLHRPDDKQGLDAWVSSSLDMFTTRIEFEASPEFYSNG